MNAATVRLEPFTMADADRLMSWIDSPRLLLQWAGPLFTYPLTRDQVRGYLAMTASGDFPARVYKAVDADTGLSVGHAELAGIDTHNRSARLARILIGDKRKRGAGLGQAMITAVLGVAFDELHLNRVDLNVYDFNHAAVACYEKAGFRIEGLRREVTRFGDEYWNSCIMSILNREWRAWREAKQTA